MAVRKTSRSEGTTTRNSLRKRTTDRTTRQFSAIVGSALIGVALLWFIWLLVRQLSPAMVSISFPLPIPGAPSQPTANPPADPLAAAGITLSAPAQGQEPLLTRQQALLLTTALEPQIAAQAGGSDARYTLFSYRGSNSAAVSYHDVAAWLVRYTGISEPQPDTAADPHAADTHHDFYVFLDANSGRELLAIWL
jgi:hypothetical protein